jgi:hypothetical protein
VGGLSRKSDGWPCRAASAGSFCLNKRQQLQKRQLQPSANREKRVAFLCYQLKMERAKGGARIRGWEAAKNNNLTAEIR